MRLWALRAALQIPHFANALVRDDNPMSCGAALVRADEASIPRWFEVAGGEFGSTPVLEPGRAGTPVLHRVFLMADRSAEQRAELRSAGQPGAAVPTLFFFQIGMRAGSAQYPSHTGNVLQAVHARLKP